jgi:membrane-associated phospholipid phosphatase
VCLEDSGSEGRGYAPIVSVKTHPATAVSPAPTSRPAGSKEQGGVGVLRARPGGPAERLAASLSANAAIVFTIAMLAGLLVIAAASIGAGLLVTRVIERAWGIGAADERVNVWLAAHRTPGRTHASLIGSIVAGGVVLPIMVGVIGLACAVLRKWRVAAFVVFALVVEAATYRLTTLVVHVHRPRVVRLEHLPVNASYPSGHTAAAVAVYGGLALLVASRFQSKLVRGLTWAFAILMVVFVALSRMYRGMHHPLDVGGGLLVGIAALAVLVFACRLAGAVYDAHHGGEA